MKIDFEKYAKPLFFLVALVFLHSLRYFDYVGLNDVPFGRIAKVLAAFLLFLSLCPPQKKKEMPGKIPFLILVLVPILSFIPCYLENGQSPFDSASAYAVTFFTFVYFILHRCSVGEGYLVKYITVVAVARTLICIIQQFTYPSYLFAFRPEGMNAQGFFMDVEIRSGIYRYYIEDTYLSMFLVFYYFQKLTQRASLKSLSLFLFGLVGIYLDQSRQFMLSAAASLVLVFFISPKVKHKGMILGFLGLVALILYLNSEKLFSDLFLLTSLQSGRDQTRALSYANYLFEFWGGPLSVIFGNGPVGIGSYADQVQYLQEVMHMYRADIGIAGAFNLYGVTGVLSLLSFFVFYVFRKWKKLPMHLRMYYTASIINMPLITIYTQNINWFVFFAFMLYLSDRSIARAERREEAKRCQLSAN